MRDGVPAGGRVCRREVLRKGGGERRLPPRAGSHAHAPSATPQGRAGHSARNRERGGHGVRAVPRPRRTVHVRRNSDFRAEKGENVKVSTKPTETGTGRRPAPHPL